MADATDSMIKAMRIKTPNQQTKINTLSGGNQQKVIFGRWLLTRAGRAAAGRADARH